jgi:hypothetical protein
MQMSDLIELYNSDRVGARYTKTLARALAKTGPLFHGAYCWSGKMRYGQAQVTKALKFPKAARQSSSVEVPWGIFPELSAGSATVSMNTILIDRFRSYLQALESGIVTSENSEDMESLVDHLENLADDIRHWGLSKIFRQRVEQITG